MTLRAVLWLAVSGKVQAEDDKISLPEQERLERAYCEAHNYQVVDVLSVPGHSRSESDVITLMEEYSTAGILAYHRLRAHWKTKDFDVLLAYDFSRLARSQTLIAFVIENVIRSGAKVYLIDGGEITADNADLQIALGGISATSGVKRLVRLRGVAMDRRAQNGLPTTNKKPFSHLIVRDEKHQAVRMIVDESKRRLFDDLATLLLEGVAYNSLETELYTRFGHADPATGQPYPRNTFVQVLHRPTFWGHSARHLNRHMLSSTVQWGYDPDILPPIEVKMWRDTHPPVYTGDQAAQVIAELRRRRRENDVVVGKQRARDTSQFAGLLVCGECGRSMIMRHRTDCIHGRTKWQCMRGYPSRHVPEPCQAPESIWEADVVEYIDTLLRAAIESADPDTLFATSNTPPDATDRAQAIRDDIAKAEDQARRLTTKLLDPRFDELQAMLETNLAGVNEQLKILRRNLAEATRPIEDPITRQTRRATLNEIADMTLAAFWMLTTREINQSLHRVFGKKRLLVRGRAIADIVERI